MEDYYYEDVVFAERLAVVKNNEAMAKWTLRELCLKAVVEHRAVLTKISETCGQPRVDDLPSGLKDDLLRFMARDIVIYDYPRLDYQYTPLLDDCCCDFIISLLHANTKIYQLPRRFRTEPSMHLHLRLMRAVSAKCKRLQLLKARPSNYGMEEDVNHWFKPSIYDLLSQQVNLRVLQLLDAECNGSDLQQIAKLSPNLVVLQVLFIHDDFLDNEEANAGIKALSTLPNLKKFLFDTYCNLQHEKRLLLMCAQFVPQLEMLKWDTTNGYLPHRYNEETYCYHQDLVEQEQPVPLGLQHLILPGQVRLHPTCQLPELKALYLRRPSGDVVELFNRFQTFTELTLYIFQFDQVKLMLQEVGRRLTKLHLLKITDTSVTEILEHCPNLKSLELSEFSIKDFSTKGPTNLFQSLENVLLDTNFMPLPQDFLKQLLSAPKLKKLEMVEIYPTVTELNKLLVLVQEGRVLRNISHLEWINSFTNSMKKPWMADKAHIQLLFDTIRISFPQIKLITALRTY